MGHIVSSVEESKTLRLTVSAGLATSALMLFDSSLITPNYNSLNFQAFLISAIGLVLAGRNQRRTRIISWVLIGVGIWLVFMAKPSSGLVFGFGLFFYLLLAGGFSIHLLGVAFLCSLSLFLLSALLFDGSVVGFLTRVKLGIEFSMFQGGGYELNEMLRIDRFELDKRTKIAFLWILFALLIALIASLKARTSVSFLISMILKEFIHIVFVKWSD